MILAVFIYVGAETLQTFVIQVPEENTHIIYVIQVPVRSVFSYTAMIQLYYILAANNNSNNIL